MRTIFLLKRLNGADHSEDVGTGCTVIFKRLFKIWLVGGEGIYLAQNRDWWRALVTTVMNFRVL